MPKLNKKLRGMEVAQVVLLIAIAVAITIALFLVLSGMVSGTPVPKVQLDSYNSKLIGTNAYIVVKFGEDAQRITSVSLTNGTRTVTCTAPTVSPIRSGQTIEITCTNVPLLGNRLVVRLTYITSGGTTKNANLEWMLG